MGQYTENLSANVAEEQMQRIEEADEEGEYASKADYIRSMVEAGESNIAALDPRTSDTDSSTNANHDRADEAAAALSDTALIDQLEQGESNKQGYEESIQKLRQEFEDKLVSRLMELARDPSSPVQADGTGDYYLEES